MGKMVNVSLRYGQGDIAFGVPEQNLLGIFESRTRSPVPDLGLRVRQAVREAGLENMVKEGDRVCIIIDDITRPTPSQAMLEALLDELNSLKVKDENIRIVVGIGLHRKATPQDFRKLVGENIMSRIQVLNPEPRDPAKNTFIGKTSFGTEVSISSLVAESDVKITLGYIGPHQGAGYSGGRKSIIPGVASEDTIVQHHGKWYFDPGSRMGSLEGNNFHLDMEEAARMSRVNLIVNVVMNTRREVVEVVAGDLVEVHRQGVKVADEISRVRLPQLADVVITGPGGYPRDIDLRTSQKAVPAAEMSVREGGFIILPARCEEGLGMSQIFHTICTKASNANEAMNMAKEIVLREGYDQSRIQVYLFCRAISKARIILVSEGVSSEDACRAFLIPASSVEEALNLARDELGKDPKIAVFPAAPEIIPHIN